MLNLRVVVWTLIGLIAGGGGAWLWHAWQVRDFAGGAIEQGRQLEAKAGDLTDEAEQLVAQGKAEKDQGHVDKAQDLFQKAQGRAEEAFKARQAALQYYLRYAELNPDDPQGPAALARLSQETGNLPAAVEWYATALRAAKNQSEPWPEAAETRARRAELLFAWGQAFQRQATRTGRQEERDAATARLREAQEEAAAVLADQNIDPETRSKASRALALALLGLHDLDALDLKAVPEQIGSVGEVLQQASQQNPADGELALALARVYRQFPELLSDSQRAAFGAAGEQEQKRQAAADQVMRQLVETAEQKLSETPDSQQAQLDAASARISRYQYLARYELPGAESDLQRALQLAPSSAQVNYLAGLDSIRKAETLEASEPGNLVARQELLQKACASFQAAKDVEFGNAYMYLGLADAQQRLGKTGDATATLELGLQNVGKTDWSLGVALIDAILRNPQLTDEQTKQLEQLFKNLDDGLTAGRLSLSELVRRSREAQRDVLRARWLAQSNDFVAAADLLVRVLTDRSLAASGQSGAQTANLEEARARLLLARCYEAQARKKLADAAASKQAAEAVKTTPDAAQSPDLEARTQEADRQAKELLRQAAETYQQLSRDLPGASQLREAAGRLFLAAGQPDIAVLDLQQALKLNDSIGLRFLLARARLEQARSGGDLPRLREAAENELNELEKRLQQEPSTQPWAVDLLRAELSSLKAGDAKDSSEQALALLRKTEQDFPLSVDLLNLLVPRYQALASDDDVKRGSALLEIAKAFAEGRPADAAVPEDMLKNLVGQDAPLWRFCRANRLLMEPAADPKQQKDRIAEARGLAEGLLSERPDWPQAHLLSASVQRAEGNLVDAVASLEKACDLQPANLRILDQLIRMQLQIGQADQAEARLAKARETFSTSDALLQLEMLVKRSAGDRETAVKLAREEVAKQPAELAPRMRLATLLQEAGQTDEAEKLFREALLIQPDNPAPMTALFALYGQTDKKQQAEAMLQELASNEKLEPYQKALVLARGHEALGQSEQAEKQYVEAEKAYRTAIEAKPADQALRLQLIDLLLRGDDPARDPARFDAAEQEVNSLLKAAPDSVDARRAQVRILWSRNQGDDRQRALALSQTLSADQGSADDRYRLGLMLESMGDFAKAGEVFDQVMEAPALNAAALVDQIRRNIRTGQLAKAEAELARLERMAPDALGTIALRIEFLHQSGRDDEIDSLIQRLKPRLAAEAASPEDQANVEQLIGDLYSSAEMHAKAEPHYQKLVELRPAAVGRLAACRAAQGQTSQAVELALADRPGVDALAKAEALARIFVTSTPSDDDWAAAEPVFKAAAEAHADRADLLTSIANVYIVRDQIAPAVALLEKALAIQPENLIVLNNLASLLGESLDRAADALTYVDRAIELSGSTPNLLDTKGTILIQLDRSAEAVAVLDRAVAGNVHDPRYLLHLAVACDRVNDNTKAKEMLKKALDDGLLQRPGLILTTTDKTWLNELRKKYEL